MNRFQSRSLLVFATLAAAACALNPQPIPPEDGLGSNDDSDYSSGGSAPPARGADAAGSGASSSGGGTSSSGGGSVFEDGGIEPDAGLPDADVPDADVPDAGIDAGELDAG